MYVSGLYMPASGGAEISAFSLLQALSTRNMSVTVVTSDRTQQSDRYGLDVGITVVFTKRADLTRTLAKLLQQTSFDWMITQEPWGELALRAASNFGVPSLYYARTPFGELDLGAASEVSPDLVVANSQAVSDYIQGRWGRITPVVRSIVNFDEIRVKCNTREYVTMINPTVSKGGEIFRDIAKSMPERKFLAVEGWGHLRAKEKWNLAIVRELAESYGNDPTWTPKDVALEDLGNVRRMGTTEDIRDVYSKTRVLLVPSIEAESAPRVILEAMCNGIPVIGSRVGGIPELLSEAGIIVENFRDLDEWLAAVRLLDNKSLYWSESAAARKTAGSVDFESEVERFLEILRAVEARTEET